MTAVLVYFPSTFPRLGQVEVKPDAQSGSGSITVCIVIPADCEVKDVSLYIRENSSYLHASIMAPRLGCVAKFFDLQPHLPEGAVLVQNSELAASLSQRPGDQNR